MERREENWVSVPGCRNKPYEAGRMDSTMSEPSSLNKALAEWLFQISLYHVKIVPGYPFSRYPADDHPFEWSAVSRCQCLTGEVLRTTD